MTVTASIVGGSGYTGGELLRLLLDHDGAEVGQVTSRRHAGDPVTRDHPNLRGQTELLYVDPRELEPCDVLFLCMPHGESARQIEDLADRAGHVIDLGADFRLRDGAMYESWYGGSHPNEGWLPRFVYGLAETRREEIRRATHVSGVGCNATAVNLALLPLARAGLIERAVADLKVGSSEGGAEAGPSSHHPERSGAVRSYAPVGHRHEAEVQQEIGSFELHMSVTSIEMVRGVLCTAHVFPREALAARDLWRLYREAYSDEPFVRVVCDRRGLHRRPDPKVLAGTNFADVGFDVCGKTGRVVVTSAIDNLMKGAAGSAVQAMNLMLGYEETAGLGFSGLHPI